MSQDCPLPEVTDRAATGLMTRAFDPQGDIGSANELQASGLQLVGSRWLVR
jgi:hypothetical protein